MKSIYTFLIAGLFLTATSAFGQSDVAVMANGDIKQGKVTAMEESAVKYQAHPIRR